MKKTLPGVALLTMAIGIGSCSSESAGAGDASQTCGECPVGGEAGNIDSSGGTSGMDALGPGGLGSGGGGGANGQSPSTECSFDASYVYGFVGGLQAYTDLITIAPPNSFSIVRTPAAGDATSNDGVACAAPLSGCGSADMVGVVEIMEDILDPSVQEIIAQSISQSAMLGVRAFGDSQMFFFQKSGTAGFFVGSECLDGGIGNCTPIPGAVSKLVADLTMLDQQQRMSPLCAGPLSSGS